MHKHTSQLRGPGSHNSGYHVANRGPVRRWNSFHGGGGGGASTGSGGMGNFNDGLGNGGIVTKVFQEPLRAVPRAVQALRSESVDRNHRAQPPPPPAFPRRRFSVWWVLVWRIISTKFRFPLMKIIIMYYDYFSLMYRNVHML